MTSIASSGSATGSNGSGSAAAVGTPPNAPASHGAGLRVNPVIDAAISQIVSQVRSASAKITDVRGPSSDAARFSFDGFMKHAGEIRGRALMYPYIGSGLGNGALVELMDGSVKWDMLSGIGVHFFGHSDADLTAAALRGSISDTMMQGNLIANAEAYTFADTLLTLAKKSSKMAHVYMSVSGCLANENALKICYQKHAPASRVIAFKDCFMGRSVTMSQIGDAAANRQGLPLSTLVDYMPFYDAVAAERMGQARYIEMCADHLRQYIERYPKQHACFIFELVQGEGGFNTAPREYFKVLMEICKANGIAVWDDEVQTFGRTTSMFAYEALNLGEYIDVLCVGKMTQVCATLYSAEYNPQPGLLSATFIGSGPSFAVGQRVLERLRDGDFYGETGRFAKIHRSFTEHVKALAAKHPAWFPATSPKYGSLMPKGAEQAGGAGGNGGMMRFTPFGGDKEKVMKACRVMFDEGVIVFYCGHGPYHVRMLPPMPVFEEKDWGRVFACVEKGLAKVAGG